MNIHEVEQLLNISKSSIRYYDRIGLLTPERKENGYRDFSQEDIQRLRSIIVLRNAMIPLKTIRELLEHHQDLQPVLETQKTELQCKAQQLIDAEKLCNTIISDLHCGMVFDADRYLQFDNEIHDVDNDWTFYTSLQQIYNLHPFGLPIPQTENKIIAVLSQLILLIFVRTVIYTAFFGAEIGIVFGTCIPVLYFLISVFLLMLSKRRNYTHLNHFMIHHLSEVGLLCCVIF